MSERPRPESLEAMHLAAKSAVRHNVPWVLDPVAAGVIPWRDKMIMGLCGPAADRLFVETPLKSWHLLV